MFERGHVFYFGSPPPTTLPVSFSLVALFLPPLVFISFALHRPPFAFDKKCMGQGKVYLASRL